MSDLEYQAQIRALGEALIKKQTYIKKLEKTVQEFQKVLGCDTPDLANGMVYNMFETGAVHYLELQLQKKTSQNTNLQNEITNHLTTIQKQQAEIDTLRDARANEEEKIELRETIDRLTMENEKKTQKITDLGQERLHTNTCLNERNKELKEVRKNWLADKEWYKSNKEKLTNLQRANDVHRKQKENFTKIQQDENHKHQKQVETLRGQVEQFKRDNKKLKDELFMARSNCR